MNSESDKAKSGESTSVKTEIVKNSDSKELAGMNAGSISLTGFSKLWWVSKWARQARDAYRELVHADRELNEELLLHQRTEEKLRNVDIILATDQLKRINEFDEEHRKAGLADLKDQVEAERLRRELEEIQRDRAKLKEPMSAAATPPQTAPKKSPLEQRTEEIRRSVERKIADWKAVGIVREEYATADKDLKERVEEAIKDELQDNAK